MEWLNVDDWCFEVAVYFDGSSIKPDGAAGATLPCLPLLPKKIQLTKPSHGRSVSHQGWT